MKTFGTLTRPIADVDDSPGGGLAELRNHVSQQRDSAFGAILPAFNSIAGDEMQHEPHCFSTG